MPKTKKKQSLVFSDKVSTFREAMDEVYNHFPLLVRTHGQMDFRAAFKEKSDELPAGVVMFIEQMVTIKYVLVRVLPYDDEEKVMSQKGGDFVLEHNNYLGAQLLIPLKYNGKFRLVHPPDCRKRYTNVSKVLEDRPQYVKAVTELVSISPTHTGKTKIVSKDHRLGVTGDVMVKKCKYLECTDDDNQSYFFGENARVDFIAEYSPCLYTFGSMPQSICQRCIMFDKTYANDVVIENDEEAATIQVLLSGPLRIIKQKKRRFLIGWMREKSKKTFRTVLIPDGVWDAETVQIAKFPSLAEQGAFLDSRFWPCRLSRADGKLYIRQEDKTSLTYLQTFASTSPNIAEAFSSEDEVSGDYKIPDLPTPAPPPLPVRCPTVNHEHGVVPVPPIPSVPSSPLSPAPHDADTSRFTAPRVPSSPLSPAPHDAATSRSPAPRVPSSPLSPAPHDVASSRFPKPNVTVKPRPPAPHDVTSSRSPAPRVPSSPLSPAPHDVASSRSPKPNVTVKPRPPAPHDVTSSRSPAPRVPSSPLSPAPHDVASSRSPKPNVTVKPRPPAPHNVASSRSTKPNVPVSAQRHSETEETNSEVLTVTFEVQLPMKMTKKKASLGFDKIHEDLKNCFGFKDRKTKLYPKPRTVQQTNNRVPVKDYIKRKKSVKFVDSVQSSSVERRNPPMSPRELPKTPALPPYEEISLPEAEGETHVYDYLDMDVSVEVTSKQTKPAYISVGALDMSKITNHNQTRLDFFKYSVLEVRECFKSCGLPDFAQLCYEQKLDGAFFKEDVMFLSEPPFNLQKLAILKVKRAVDGWRPKCEVETSDV